MSPLSIQFGPINSNNVGTLKTLNKCIFPVKYNEKFYTDIIHTSKKFTKYGYLEGMVVSAICCRSEIIPQNNQKRVYIMTLGVLNAYRKRQIGSNLLKNTIENCEKDSTIDYIYLHVQTSNQKAIEFYEQFGFEVTDTIPNYYKDIDPPDGFVLKKTFVRNQ